MRHSKSFDKYSYADLAEISRKGGIASGKARREKRDAINAQKLYNAALLESRHEGIEILHMSARLLRKAEQKQCK